MKGIFAIAAIALAITAPAHAKTHRSSSARCQFLRENGYSKCRVPPGMIIDHKQPLACGGIDRAENMQLQTKADALAKDRVERIGCGPKKS